MNRLGLIFVADRIDDCIDLARRTEGAGFSSVWTTEFYRRRDLRDQRERANHP
jgi:hypothetical protein